jgi:hypothetical protein
MRIERGAAGESVQDRRATMVLPVLVRQEFSQRGVIQPYQ